MRAGKERGGNPVEKKVNVKREKLGFGGYRTIIRGKSWKMGAWSGGPKGGDWDRCAKLYGIGYPRIRHVKKAGTRTYFWSEWIPGDDLWELRTKWTKDIFFLWGQEVAKIHNTGVSVWDMFPKNYIYDGKRVWFVDPKKLYSSSFPEYDVLKDIVFNKGIIEEFTQSFIEGYRTERDFTLEELLTKMLTHCYDNYQTIEANGITIKHGPRSMKRVMMLDDRDFKDKTVLDMGCSEGMLGRWAARNGAKKVVGVDMCHRGRYRIVTFASFLSMLERTDKKTFFQHIDIESEMFLTQKATYDTVFFCAILGHIKKTPREDYMKHVERLANKVLYYESNLFGKRELTEEWLKKTTSFKKIDYLGNSGENEKNCYALFRCEK